jgi:hypothetical protein
MPADNLHANRVVISSGKFEVVLPLHPPGEGDEIAAVLERVQRFLVKALERPRGCASLVLAIHRGGEDCDHE